MLDAENATVSVAGADPRACRVAHRDPALDVALLELADGEPDFADDLVVVPRGYWRGARPLLGRIQLSIDESDLPSSVQVDLPPAPASAQHLEIKVPALREGIEHGFSGAPVIEYEFGWRSPRLLGIVRARDPTSEDAVGRAGSGWVIPVERIAERFDAIAALVEEPWEREPAWHAHWEPRSRGVVSHREHGDFFSGRERALDCLMEHLRAGAGLLVVTGDRGHGKSALLARAVRASSRRWRSAPLAGAGQAGADDRVAVAALGAAVFARGLAPRDVATQIAQHLGYGNVEPDRLIARCSEDAAAGWLPSVVVDAVDESSDPRGLVVEVLVPLANAGARVAFAALERRIGPLRPNDLSRVDLDRQFADDAIMSYVALRLRAGGYPDTDADAVGTEVARRAQDNFLYAELVARTLADPARSQIDTSVGGWRDQLPTDVSHAFWEYLDRLDEDRGRVLDVLHPLAYARGDGLTVDPPELWLGCAGALRPSAAHTLNAAKLHEVAERADDYLVVSADSGDDYLVVGADSGALRLYHEGLADAIARRCAEQRLLATSQDTSKEAIERELRDASRRFVDALIAALPDRETSCACYEACDTYLLEHIAGHLADAGRAGELLERPGLLLTADPAGLRSALVRSALSVPPELEPARVAAVHALARPAGDARARATSLCAALRRQGQRDRAAAVRDALNATLPHELISGPPLPGVVSTIPDAHSGWIRAVAVVEHDGAPLVISAGGDRALRSWRLDGTPGDLNTPDAHSDSIMALAVVEHDGAPLVISAGTDRALRSWRLDGTPGDLNTPDAHSDSIMALAVVEHDGAPLVISAGTDRALRSWRLDGTPGDLNTPDAHSDSIMALAVVASTDGAPLVISAGTDRALRSWRLDGIPGDLNTPDAHSDSIRAVAVVEHDGAPLVISAGDDRALRSWRLDGTPGDLNTSNAHSDSIMALAVVEHDGAPLVISAGGDRAIIATRIATVGAHQSPPDGHPLRP